MKIINNQDTLLLNELENIVLEESIIYISLNHFTSFAFYEIIKIVKKAKQINILLDLQNKNVFEFILSDKEHILNLNLDRKYKILEVIKQIENKTAIRKGNVGNQNILIVENTKGSNCFLLTPLNLDCVSLGTIPSLSPTFIHSFIENVSQYLQLFNNSWENSQQVLNETVINELKKGTVNLTGEQIYKYSIREIFQYSTIQERADEKLEKVGFKDSVVWNMLYNFQKDAVIGAIEKIETYGGCIIADSVGLGKTFEALAVMKYYQLRNGRVLVLAPKKLRENWTIYKANEKGNILLEDRLNYDVLNHTDLTRLRGKSGDIDLEMINWGNYDLVVIDESHNFRNNPYKREGITRYKRLMNEVIRANIKTKVLMLSATPVNNRMNDLKNQIAFITEGQDSAFSSYGIESITQVMRDAQRKFTLWFKNRDLEKLSINNLMQQLDGSYFRILDMLTIARSRKHIEKYYDTTDIGKFPERLTPITLSPEIDVQKKLKNIEIIYDELSDLTLAAYSPLNYVVPDKREFYEEKYDIETRTGNVFKQADREQSLIYLMRVNLLKRLESSIYSFKLTLQKLNSLIEKTLKHLEQHKHGGIDLDLNITDIDLDDIELEDLLVGGKTKVLIQDLDLISWKQDLEQDRAILQNLLSSIVLITTQRDAKLQELKKLIKNKIENPINEGNKKVLIFSAFSDTATYLYNELKEWLVDNNLYSALVTGTGNKTNLAHSRTDLNSILTNFSPLSKKRDRFAPEETQQIDILFGTDCISEGQNLQDCDYLINYDIHWNPVRIIQRFGRIDRIGSVNKSVQLVNFFPSLELDRFIDLIAKVKGKMIMLDVSATGEDNVISKNSKEMQDLEYRRRQLKQLQDQVIDLEDIQGNISISDLTFNDFKVDLEKSSDAELEELNHIPPASFAVVKTNLSTIKEGVIFCLKDKNEITSSVKKNILHPFYLIYISKDGETRLKATQAKTALDYFRKLGMDNQKLLPDLIKLFDKETSNNKKMQTYIDLLKEATDNILGVRDDNAWDSLAKPGGTLLFGKENNKENNLELVSYLIIKK